MHGIARMQTSNSTFANKVLHVVTPIGEIPFQPKVPRNADVVCGAGTLASVKQSRLTDATVYLTITSGILKPQRFLYQSFPLHHQRPKSFNRLVLLNTPTISLMTGSSSL